MNIQDIADFLDLVKNPNKYEKALQNLKDEQARLTAVIETVGKVVEIDKLLKQAREKESKLEAKYDDMFKVVEKKAKETAASASDLQAKIKKDQEQAAKVTGDLALKAKEMDTLRSELTKREKELVSKEVAAKNAQDTLDALILEYEAKVAKLRAVMA
jgi:chromosome segregation ATPase